VAVNNKYHIDKFILDSDLERRIAEEKGLLDSLSISRTPARGNIDDIIRKYESQIRDMPYEN
jgi:hypothetical protein